MSAVMSIVIPRSLTTMTADVLMIISFNAFRVAGVRMPGDRRTWIAALFCTLWWFSRPSGLIPFQRRSTQRRQSLLLGVSTACLPSLSSRWPTLLRITLHWRNLSQFLLQFPRLIQSRIRLGGGSHSLPSRIHVKHHRISGKLGPTSFVIK